MKIITFNVFIGSPLIGIRGGTSSLYNSERLKRQIVDLKKQNADIICLQEIFCSNVLNAYIQAFQKDYQVIYETNTVYSNKILGETCILLFACLLLIFFKLLIPVSNIITDQLAIRSIYFYKIRKYLSTCAMFSFILGNIKGFMITLIKRNKDLTKSEIQVLNSRTIQFYHQSNDFQNLFRKRCYQVLELEWKFIRTGKVIPITLYHLHLNSIGNPVSKYAQFNQVIESIKKSPERRQSDNLIICGDFNSDLNTFKTEQYEFLQDSAILFKNQNDHTWSDQNPLSKGFLREENSRVDGILYSFKDFQQVSYQTIMNSSPYTSDHFGISMDFNEITNLL